MSPRSVRLPLPATSNGGNDSDLYAGISVNVTGNVFLATTKSE